MSEQQWEYRAYCDHFEGDVAYTPDLALSTWTAKCEPELERRPVGDWQPFDPEADR